MEPPEDGAADEATRPGVPDGPVRREPPDAESAGADAAGPGDAGADAADPAGAGPAGTDPVDSAHDAGADGARGATDEEGGEEDLGAISRLSLPSRVVVAVAVAAVAVGVLFHLGMVFLHVAPPNTLSEEHSQTVSDYIYPEFEQNWKLFAPNPVQDNTDVEARAEVRRANGTLETTGWVDLTAADIAKIRHDPIPSHTVQNELRRAWGFYTDSHDAQGRPIGLRGALSAEYVEHIVAHRFGPRLDGGAVQRVEVRVATSPVAAPSWDSEKIDTRTTYQVLPWWAVSPEDYT